MKIATERILIRARLMDELVEDGLNVAVPTNECGVDMLAFLETAPVNQRILAVPIQVRDLSDFVARGRNGPQGVALLLAYVSRPTQMKHSHFLAFTRTELLAVIKIMHETRPSRDRDELLEPFKMSPGRWQKKIRALTQA